MAAPAKRRATYQDVLDAPDHVVAEIVDGERHVSPRPGGPHTFASSTLGFLIGPAFQLGRGGPGGWIILDEPELHFGADLVVPDLAGWRAERLPDPTPAAYYTIAPDWVCEVLARSTAVFDRAQKLPVYARAGVQHVWLVDAIQRTIEVFRAESGSWLLVAVHHDDARSRAEPFDAIELDLALLWRGSPPLPTRASEAAAEP